MAGARRGARSLGFASAFAVAVGAVPALAAPIVGLTGSNTLVGFDSAAPGTVTSTLGVTGLGGDTLRGIDFRPSNGALYGIGSSGTLYVIDSATGSAMAIGPGVPIAAGSSDVGFAFNPVPDAIRVVTPSDQNLRVNPTTGLTTTDTPLAFAAGDPNAGADPSVASSAYTNQVAGPVASTTLYGIDATTGSLVLQASPNAGTLTTIGLLGLGGRFPARSGSTSRGRAVTPSPRSSPRGPPPASTRSTSGPAPRASSGASGSR